MLDQIQGESEVSIAVFIILELNCVTYVLIEPN
jgi:hypothetical protein